MDTLSYGQFGVVRLEVRMYSKHADINPGRRRDLRAEWTRLCPQIDRQKNGYENAWCMFLIYS